MCLIWPLTCGNVALVLLSLAGRIGGFRADGRGVKRGCNAVWLVAAGSPELRTAAALWWQSWGMNNVLPSLGRLTPVPPREVWVNEAQHFTPWLLQNADVLGDLLNMDLALEQAEHPVGGFSLDLIGRDQATGEVVIVENQLEMSDHSHLGQLLTYAAGTGPTNIVWVVSTFRPEHRAALDWLNARTDEETRFFGVEIAVVRINDSEPAPSFRLVAQPNDWQKSVRGVGGHSDVLTARQELYREFWTRWLELLRAERPAWSRATRPPRDHWFTTTAGVAGAVFYTTFTRQGLSSELVFESPNGALNTARLEMLREQRRELEAAYGSSLDWQDMPGRKATRVAEYLPDADVAVREEWDTYLEWLLDRQARLRGALAAVGGVPVAADPPSL